MRSGVIAVPDMGFGTIESFSEERETENGPNIQACLEVRDSGTSDRGHNYQMGRAAIQQIGTEEAIDIDLSSNRVTVSEKTNVVKTQFTEFLVVPGEFAVASSGKGDFVFRLISNQTDASRLHSVEVLLDRMIESFEQSDEYRNLAPWQVGFFGKGGDADKGILYGNSIYSDSEFGNLTRDLPKNQLGLTFEYDRDEIKMNATKSGYVRVYQPSSYDEKEFVDFVMEHILPYTQRPQ